MPTATQITDFQQTVWDYYKTHGRSMPWRSEPTPYNVMVSEIMLQQTQVPRVMQKFAEFMATFPTLQHLAAAPLADVLAVWSGLGYNRRAKYLWEAAKAIVHQHDGILPNQLDQLIALPGIGPNTAGAIKVYVFNDPAVFIETNIRTVMIHHFFADHADAVDDTQIKHIVAATLPTDSPRQWYWALMDYGTHLKVTKGGQLQRAKHYRKQSKFEGSRRQIRGQVLKALVGVSQLSLANLAAHISDPRLPEVLETLQKEGLVVRQGDQLHLTQA